MAREIPHPMPLSMRDETNVMLRGKSFTSLDDSARFEVRRLVADAYAKGFLDGRIDESANDSTDRAIARDREARDG